MLLTILIKEFLTQAELDDVSAESIALEEQVKKKIVSGLLLFHNFQNPLSHLIIRL